MRVTVVGLALTVAVLATTGCITDVQCGEANPTNARAEVLFLGRADPEALARALEGDGWSLDQHTAAYTLAGKPLEAGGHLTLVVQAEDAGGPDGSTRFEYERATHDGSAGLRVKSPQEAREALAPHIQSVNRAMAADLGEPLQTRYQGGSNDCSPGGFIG